MKKKLFEYSINKTYLHTLSNVAEELMREKDEDKLSQLKSKLKHFVNLTQLLESLKLCGNFSGNINIDHINFINYNEKTKTPYYDYQLKDALYDEFISLFNEITISSFSLKDNEVKVLAYDKQIALSKRIANKIMFTKENVLNFVNNIINNASKNDYQNLKKLKTQLEKQITAYNKKEDAKEKIKDYKKDYSDFDQTMSF